MEYPILPGSVISGDVEYVGQRVQRPNAVERQIQHVDRIPVQRVAGYQTLQIAPQSMFVEQPPTIVQQAPSGPIYASPTVIPSRHVQSERCCSTRVTIAVSVFFICLLIGAGIGLYFKFGRDNDDSSNSSNNVENQEKRCIIIGFDKEDDDVDYIIIKDNDDNKNEKDRDDKHHEGDSDGGKADSDDKKTNSDLSGKHSDGKDDDEKKDSHSDKGEDKNDSSDESKGTWVKEEGNKIKWHNNKDDDDIKNLPSCPD